MRPVDCPTCHFPIDHVPTAATCPMCGHPVALKET